MKLTQEQLQQFDRDGYLFFPSLFSEPEIKVLDRRGPGALRAAPPGERPREGQRRGAHELRRAHVQRASSRGSRRHPRMIEPVKQLFGEDVYMHQFKINGKVAFDGDLWQWHQDYGTWQADDQMPEARAMNIAIFLNEVNEFNGPLMFIPGSHRLGVVEAGHDTTTTSYPLWTIDHDTIRKLVERGGLVAPKGPAGSMIMFHGCLVHASTSNLSPWDRWNVYLSLCAVSNHIRRFKRPAYIAHRDFTPIACLPDDCLLRDYDVASAVEGRHARGRAEADAARGVSAEHPRAAMNLYAKLTERAAQGKPLRVGLIGAGKFGAMYLAQVPKTPGRASRRHRRSVAGERAREPRAASAGRPSARRAVARRGARAAAHARRRRLARRWSRIPAIEIVVEATGNPIAAVTHALAAFRARQARRHGHRRGRRVLRPAAGAKGARGGRRLQPRLRRPAGADLRPGRLGARRRVRRRRRRARAQVAAALRAVDARDGVGVLRPDAGAGARRRAEPEDVQLVPRRLEAGDREHRGVQCHRADAGAVGARVSAGEHRRHARASCGRARKAASSITRARWRWCPRSSPTAA